MEMPFWRFQQRVRHAESTRTLRRRSNFVSSTLITYPFRVLVYSHICIPHIGIQRSRNLRSQIAPRTQTTLYTGADFGVSLPRGWSRGRELTNPRNTKASFIRVREDWCANLGTKYVERALRFDFQIHKTYTLFTSICFVQSSHCAESRVSTFWIDTERTQERWCVQSEKIYRKF